MRAIYKKFEALESEKRERIINAAIDEFEKNGYDNASTNEITKNAKISKGSLFVYFGSKQGLYFYLLEAMIRSLDIIYEEVNWDEKDFLVRLKEIGLIKSRVIKKYPSAFRFLLAVTKEDSMQVRAEVEKKVKFYSEEAYAKVYEGIDFSKFKADIDLAKMIKMINWTINGLAEEYRGASEPLDMLSANVLKEFDEYLELMRRCFYK